MKVVVAGMKIGQAQGGLDIRANMEHIRIASLAAIAECRAVWFFLEQRGMVTAAQKEDFLDKGYDHLLAQVETDISKILIATPNGNGRG